eukprot:jgi/Ulvmu1/4986/UM021_0003.1
MHANESATQGSQCVAFSSSMLEPSEVPIMQHTTHRNSSVARSYCAYAYSCWSPDLLSNDCSRSVFRVKLGGHCSDPACSRSCRSVWPQRDAGGQQATTCLCMRSTSRCTWDCTVQPCQHIPMCSQETMVSTVGDCCASPRMSETTDKAQCCVILRRLPPSRSMSCLTEVKKSKRNTGRCGIISAMRRSRTAKVVLRPGWLCLRAMPSTQRNRCGWTSDRWQVRCSSNPHIEILKLCCRLRALHGPTCPELVGPKVCALKIGSVTTRRRNLRLRFACESKILMSGLDTCHGQCTEAVTKRLPDPPACALLQLSLRP